MKSLSLLSVILISLLVSTESKSETSVITIDGVNQNGTNSSDYFVIQSGVNLDIDALQGIDFIEALILGSAQTTLAYSSSTDTISIYGDDLSVTGNFSSFEDIQFSFDETNNDIKISGRSWRPTFIDAREGEDKITTPYTGVVGGRVYVSSLSDGVFKVKASNGHLADFTFKNFEILSTTNGESNLYISSDDLVQFKEVHGGESSTLDTLYIEQGSETVFIWDENGIWYFSTLGSETVTQIHSFEFLDINASTIYTTNKELFSTSFGGNTLYGIDSLQFYSNSTDIRAIDNLNTATFFDVTSENIESIEVARPEVGSGAKIIIDGVNQNGTNSSDYFVIQ
ncbi:hypothetical protein, partial [Opacimonas viscosa]